MAAVAPGAIASSVVLDGSLKRKSMMGWKTRYYVVTSTGFLEEYDARGAKETRQRVALQWCDVERGTSSSRRSHVFSIMRLNKKAIVLQAESKSAMRAWVKAIRSFSASVTSSTRAPSLPRTLSAADGGGATGSGSATTTGTRTSGGGTAAGSATTRTSRRSPSNSPLSTFAVSTPVVDVRAIPSAALVGNERGIITDANAALTALLGFTVGDLCGYNCSMLMSGIHRNKHDSYIQQYLATGDRRVIGRPRRVVVCAKDGSHLTVLLQLSEFMDNQRDSRLFLAVLSPIARDLVHLVDQTASPAVCATVAGAILSTNSALQHLLGFTSSELVGANVSILMPPTMRKRHDAYIEHFTRTNSSTLLGKPRRVVAQHRSGALVPVLLCLNEVVENSERVLFATLTEDSSKEAHKLLAASAAIPDEDDDDFGYDDEDDDDSSGSFSDDEPSSKPPKASPSASSPFRSAADAKGAPATPSAPVQSLAKAAPGSLTSSTNAAPRLSSASSSSCSTSSHSPPTAVAGGVAIVSNNGHELHDPFARVSNRLNTVMHEELLQLQREMLNMQQRLEQQDKLISLLQAQQQQQQQQQQSGLDGSRASRSPSSLSKGTSSGNVLSSGGGKLLNLTLNLDHAIVQERISAGGGSSAAVYSCSIDGWRCALKELNIERCNSATIEAFVAEIRMVESLPPHPNIVRYLAHERRGDTIRLYMTRYSATLDDHLNKLRGSGSSSGSGSSAAAAATAAARKGAPSPGMVARWTRDIVAGLRFLVREHTTFAQPTVSRLYCTSNVAAIL